MKRIISFCTVLTLLVLGFFGCAKEDGRTVLKLGHSLDEKHPVHIAMAYMGELLEEKSGGKITLRIYPNEQLGSEREMIENVQLGSLDLMKTSTSPLESFVPAMGVFSVPYAFRDSEHSWKVLLGPIGEKLRLAGTAKGLRGLCFYDAGARSFYTKKKAIVTPEDLKGLSIRVMESETSMAMVSALGAAPTPIPWGELYTSLAQGVVDGAENNPPSFQTAMHYEVCKFYSLDEHTRVPDILLISQKVWESFTPEERTIVQEAADESSIYQRKLWKEMTDKSIEIVKAAGVEVSTPDKTPFMEAVKPMHESYKGTEIGALLEEIKKTE